VYQGNISAIVKAIIAPLEDMIRITKKDEQINAPRQFGNMRLKHKNNKKDVIQLQARDGEIGELYNDSCMTNSYDASII